VVASFDVVVNIFQACLVVQGSDWVFDSLCDYLLYQRPVSMVLEDVAEVLYRSEFRAV